MKSVTICAEIVDIALYKKSTGLTIRTDDDRIVKGLVRLKGKTDLFSKFTPQEKIWIRLEQAEQ